MKQSIHIIYIVLLMLTISCAAKRKSTSIISRLSEEKSEAKSQFQQEYKVKTRLLIDSSSLKSWIKIYPRGHFIINKDGFSGSADSLNWYVSLQKINKRQERKGLTVTQIDSTASKYSSQKTHQQQLLDKTRSNIGGWIWGVCIIVILVLLKKHIYK